MNIVEILARKRDGLAHTEEEIRFLMRGVADGQVELHQTSAWLMATRLNGMTNQETVWLTQAMIDSGETVDLSELGGIPVDKHSTGGVGDTTTLILAPLVAAAGGQVAKMSGRGLGHTGGTLDKMEAAGLNVNLSSERFMAQVKKIGVAVISQTAKLVPADGVLYSIRDVTATIDSVPLIASSVMSKKLACGAQAILLDVKYGDGAFMADLDGARDLARTMVEIGRRMGRRVKAALSSMEQPLGSAIGNVLEFRAAIDVLTGQAKDTPLARVSQQLASELLVMAELAPDRPSAEAKVQSLLDSGAAAQKLEQLIEAQDGDPRIVSEPDRLPRASIVTEVRCQESGVLTGLAAKQLGLAGLKLGAGRLRKSDPIDPAVGIVLQRRVGDRLEKGDVVAQIHASSQESAAAAQEEILNSLSLGQETIEVGPELAEWVG